MIISETFQRRCINHERMPSFTVALNFRILLFSFEVQSRNHDAAVPNHELMRSLYVTKCLKILLFSFEKVEFGSRALSETYLLGGSFFLFSFMYDIQHCFICRPSESDSTVSEDAGIEPSTVATTALDVRPSNHSARSHPQSRLDLVHKLG
jgi:hypothetical protein